MWDQCNNISQPQRGNLLIFNQIDIQYEVEGEDFPNSEGKCRIKVLLGMEQYYGGGNTILEAKQAAAMQVMLYGLGYAKRSLMS